MPVDLMTSCESSSPCSPTETGGLERTRFYPRQIVTSDDLTQDQHYFRERQRRHNRLLHGWGVVCGACVRRNAQNPCEVTVEPGYVLGPYGDDIVIPEAVTFDLCKQGVMERDGCCPEVTDPWCVDTQRQCPEGRFFLAVRYAECRTRPVKTGGCSCGCEGDSCEYSRTRDSFAVKVLTELPSSYTTPMQQPLLDSVMGCRNGVARICPPCPTDPWVILADLVVGRDCKVSTVDCYAHRRYVISFADFYFLCTAKAGGPAAKPERYKGSVPIWAGLVGTEAVMDIASSSSGAAPTASVTMKRPDGTPVAVPAFFSVDRGMTVATLLERDGDRLLYDPATNDTFTLRELYSNAGVAPDTVLTGAASALAPLEGRTLDVSGARSERNTVAEHVGDAGLELLNRDLGGAAVRAGELPAATLRVVEASPQLRDKLGGQTIAEVAAKPEEEFVATAVEGVAKKSLKNATEEAKAVWAAAKRVSDVSSRPE